MILLAKFFQSLIWFIAFVITSVLMIVLFPLTSIYVGIQTAIED
ncbi:hypothetical protein DYBT9275_01439 [Dyadobacter sp. CECT 9275]|uniref:Uncharacterized protein n=1 Tax=Dyadobacter helix TaxID=2822344 RepID=A0A916NKG7_9BACT|nr:hypothetical protein DYBT9275_01439 [Dyadobacter sp. CECT 9275]